MLTRQITTHKEIFTEQIFSRFCQAINYGSAEEFADIVYGRFMVEEGLTFADDYQYWGIYDYFLSVVIPHKIAVFNAGKRLTELPWFGDLYIDKNEFIDNLWLHDISKFSFVESIGYSQYNFKTKSGSKKGFDLAWNHHKQHNDHHPEYWLSVGRSGEVKPLRMSKESVLEMVADWNGAGETYGNSLGSWLPDNLPTFRFHHETSHQVKRILTNLGFDVVYLNYETHELGIKTPSIETVEPPY